MDTKSFVKILRKVIREEVSKAVKQAINDQINSIHGLNKIADIGEQKGDEPRPGKVLLDSEGVICLYVK